METGEESELEDVAESESEESSGDEGGEESESKGPKDNWDKLQALSPLITGVVLAAIGYFLTGSVNQAFQTSQLQFNYVKEMQELLSKLGDPKINPEEAKTTAVALAAFGSFSIAPLLNEIQSGELNRPAAGEYGLRAVALADPANTCPALGRVLENRSAAYNWLTHRAAIRILGSANCQTARSVLGHYRARLARAASSPDGFAAFQETLTEEPHVTKETVDLLKAELEKTFKLLEQSIVQE
jgi:hypothetical protein